MKTPSSFLIAITGIEGSPIATTPLAYTIPESLGLYRLKAILVELLASAVVANREVSYSLTNKGGFLKQIAASARFQVANEDVLYTFGITGTAYTSASTTFVHVPAQSVLVEPGDIVRLSAGGSDAGDTWGPEAQLYFEAVEWD